MASTTRHTHTHSFRTNTSADARREPRRPRAWWSRRAQCCRGPRAMRGTAGPAPRSAAPSPAAASASGHEC
eukprot:1614911-Rhodomonas_salina.1